jgi:hypothetical protein
LADQRRAGPQQPRTLVPNRTWTYPELEAHREAAFEPFLTIEERTERAGRCRAALDEMADAYARAKIDVAIVLGKDQKEIWPDQSPSITIYTGEDVHNGPPQRPSTRPTTTWCTRPIRSWRPI